MKIVVISGSPRTGGNTEIMMQAVYDYIKKKEANVEFINLAKGGIDYFTGSSNVSETTKHAAQAIMDADIWLIGTPIYNSFFSAALKNLFEYIDYKKTAGKIAGVAIMAAGDIGFTFVGSLLNQLMSYFGVIVNPKAVYMKTSSIVDEKPNDDSILRLHNLVDKTISMSNHE